MKERVILYGGTFDPPHLGHKALVDYVQKQLNPDRIIVIPCFIQPLKDLQRADAIHRLKMSKIMFKDVSDFEISKQSVSYTIDTIAYFKKEFKDSRLMFLMGADSFLEIKKWKAYKDILKEVNIVVISRGVNCDIAELVKKAEVENLFARARIINKDIQIAFGKNAQMLILLCNFNYPVSSTLIRDLINTRNEAVINYLDTNVWEYIIDKNLYGNEGK